MTGLGSAVAAPAAGRAPVPTRWPPARAQGLPFWDDPHNADPRFTRVRLRHEVLPLLEEVLAGGVAEALARTAAQLRDDGEALDAAAATCSPRVPERRRRRAGTRDSRRRCSTPTAPRAARTRPPSAGGRLRSWLQTHGVTGLTDLHLRAADDLVGRWRGQGAVALPRRLELVRERGRLRVRTAAWPGAR